MRKLNIANIACPTGGSIEGNKPWKKALSLIGGHYIQHHRQMRNIATRAYRLNKRETLGDHLLKDWQSCQRLL